MTDNFKPLQAQSFSLSGGGAIAGATSIILKSFAQIDGALIMMADLGTIAFMTLEPGNGTLEEQISFTGVTQNSNGTATLTGVSNVTFADPYTQTSGTAKTHAGSTTAILSNTSGFYNQLDSKNDDAIITGHYQFPPGGNINAPTSGTAYITPTNDLEYASKKYVDTVAVSGAPNANTTTKGIVQEATQAQVDAKTQTGSTGAELFANPSNLRATKINDYLVAGGTTNAFTLTPTPAITAYAAGQVFIFQSISTNNSAVTINISGLGAKNLNKGTGSTPLVTGDIVGNQIYTIAYDGTEFQVIAGLAPMLTGTIQMYGGSSAPQGWSLCDGSALSRTATNTANLFAVIGTSFGTGDGSTTYNIPDLRGRVGVGKNSATFVTLGATGGEETHVLTTPEIPSHTHTYIATLSSSGTGPTEQYASSGNGPKDVTDATGGGGAHNNIQPYQVVNYIIKL